MIYYNEHNKGKAEDLKKLMSDGFIPSGDVDTRDIQEVKAYELKGYNQCHFFAGWGGWAYALRLAGWKSDKPVWTASPPCQGYSQIGKGKGYEDYRDLCPAWIKLLSEYTKEYDRPVCFGEQVAESIKYGWLDRLYDDMEATDYACWAVVLPSCAGGTFDKRERLFFVGDPDTQRLERYARDASQIIERTMAYGYSAQAGICDKTEFIKDWRGYQRPVKPGIPLLVDGLSGRMVRKYSEGFGDAINPKIAAEIIRSYITTGEMNHE